MHKNIDNEVANVTWEDIDEDEGRINFRSNIGKRKITKFIKIILIILIAVISGGIGGAYIVEKKYSYIINQSKPFQSRQEIIKDLPKTSITNVVEIVGPTVVGISKKSKNYFGVEDIDSGSGIIFDSDGYIVTNNDVIKDTAKVTVKLPRGKILDAKIIGKDAQSDLAVIKVDAKNLPMAKFGNSSKVKAGDIAIAIGNPQGEEFTGSVTAGIISALNKKIQYGGANYKLIQTDASINFGNRGGALCNEVGEVIGINSFKITKEKNMQGMGVAIAINEVKKIIESLMDYGKVPRVLIGIYGKTIELDKDKIKGVYIREVIPKSGAAIAGIKPTDIIIELDNKKVSKFEDLSDILYDHKMGDEISCKIWRNGEVIKVNIALSEVQNYNKE